MPVSQDIRQQLLKIDEQLIDILAERVNICQKAMEEDEDAFNPATQAEIISDWEAAADERGLNVVTMNHS
jgi:chorismate mutase